MVVVAVKLKLSRKNKIYISDRMEELERKRKKSQPQLPSLGSVFKKVGDVSAGYYIEKVGLKGMKIGGAMVSDIHANFIVNTGGASSQDYKNLVDFIKEEVKSKLSINITEEVIYL